MYITPRLPRTIGATLWLACAPVAFAATWTGNTGAYATGDNWDTGSVPCDELTSGDNTAVIDVDVFVNQNVALCTVSSLTLGADAVFQPQTGTRYAAAAATIDGRISGQGGMLTIAQAVLGPGAAITTSGGSVIEVGANSITSTSPADVSKNILVSSGAGSLIDLSSAATLDAAYDSNSPSGTFHRINVQNGGNIDLSGLFSITGPVDLEDRLFIDASSGGSIDFSSLSDVSAGGFVMFEASDGATIDLPAASALSSTIFSAQPGGSIRANTSSWTYGYNTQTTRVANLMVASGTGVLDLSGANALDLTFPSFARQLIIANGGLIDLSGTQTIAIDGSGAVEIMTDGGGRIDLSQLSTVNTNANFARIIFQSGGSDTIDLASLQNFGPNVYANFITSGTSQMLLPSITSTVNARFTASDASQIVGPASLATITDLFGISTSGSALVDFSAARGLTYPGSTGGRSIVATDSSEIDLSGVITIASESPAYINVGVGDDATLRLDDLTTIDMKGVFSLAAGGGAVLELPSLQDSNGATFFASNQGHLIANERPWTYSNSDYGLNQYFIMRADGDGTTALLDMGGLQTIDVTSDNSLEETQFVAIAAVDGGIVNLDSVTHIEGPIGEDDTFTIRADGGEIYLDSLQTIETAGRVEIDAGGKISLSSLRTIQTGGQLDIFARDSASLELPAIEPFHPTTVSASSDGQIIFNEQTATLRIGSQASPTVLAATSGSRVDLSSVTTIDSTFTSGFLVSDNVISANGGELDISGLEEIVLPSGDVQELRFEMRYNGLLKLGPIKSVIGSGFVRLIPASNATIEFPSGINMPTNIQMLDWAGSNLHVHGDYSFEHQSVFFYDISRSVMLVTGDAPVDFEVGGLNDGATMPSLSNFAIGQLQIGTQEQPVDARLVDAVFNGRGDLCATVSSEREALYLFGLFADPDADGLSIANGSTLDLGGLDVYAEVGGVIMHLNPLVTPGVPYPYDDGFLLIDTVLDIDRDGVQDGDDNCVHVPNTNQLDSNGDGYGNACDADLDGDLTVNNVDLGLFKLAFHASDGDTNWNPDADFNGDLKINAVDLGLLKLRFFEPPGPACPMPGA